MSNKTIILSLTVLTLIGIVGCGSKLQFTYSDSSSENYSEKQRHENPWNTDNAVLELEKYDVSEESFDKNITARVKEVIDVASVRLENGEIIKYIGIQPPSMDSKSFEEGRNFNKLLVSRKEITLEYDIRGRDNNGNLLAYVFAEGHFVNAEVIKHGFARYSPDRENTKYEKAFIMYQKDAMKRGNGIWALEE